MATALHKWQPILFILVFGLALSAFAHNYSGNEVQNTELSRPIPRFDGKPHGEYERAVDLFFYTLNGSNEEFKAFETLMSLLVYKEDVDVALERLRKLDDESLNEEDQLRKTNLEESLERKKSELEERPVQVNSTSAGQSFSSAKQGDSGSDSASVSFPTSVVEKQNGSNRVIIGAPLPASVRKKILGTSKKSVAKGSPLPTIQPQAKPALVSPPTNSSAPVVIAAYNPPSIGATTNVTNPDAPRFDDGVFELDTLKEASLRRSGGKPRAISDGAPRPIRTPVIASEPTIISRVAFNPPNTNPGILRKLSEWVTGFEQSRGLQPQLTMSPPTAPRQPKVVPPNLGEAAGMSSLQAFQAQMTAISE